QGFPADGLFDQKVREALRDGGRADHLVTELVAQVGFGDGEGKPASNVFDFGLGEHVADGIGHAQVGGDGSVEDAAEDGEDVGGRAADVHAEDVDAALGGDGLHDLADGVGGGHNAGAGPGGEFAITGRLLHD